jgi:1-acyl-sn-glycerol-3-phosphate acyltransferase
MSKQAGEAEVIALDPMRRQRATAARARCSEVTVEGRPCRNYAGPSGYCRVHEPEPADGGSAAQAAADSPERSDLDERLAAALAFLRRRLTGDYDVDLFGFDRELTEAVMPIARPLYYKYWRVRATGLDNVPNQGGALIAANHSGTLPIDALMVKSALYEEHPAHRHVRELAADLALSMPVVGAMARKTGNTLAHDEDALRLLASGELVAVYPEGFKGIGKLYKDRYKLQRFGRGGFVEVALRAQVPIIPVAVVGAEEIFPMIANAKTLARMFGLPYFPITWTFPWLGPLGLLPLPSKWVIDFGEPIDTTEYGADSANDPMLVFELTDRVRDTIQQMLYRNLMGRRSIFF